jgi:hypothetical protein
MRRIFNITLLGVLALAVGCSDSSAVGAGPDPARPKPSDQAVNEMPPAAREAMNRQSQIASEAAQRNADFYKNRGK